MLENSSNFMQCRNPETVPYVDHHGNLKPYIEKLCASIQMQKGGVPLQMLLTFYHFRLNQNGVVNNASINQPHGQEK
jgi:hypothetical protein